MEVESYDKVVEILELTYENQYTIKPDGEMPQVWWVSIEGRVVFMVTSLQRAFQVERTK